MRRKRQLPLPHQTEQPIPSPGHGIEALRGRLRDCGYCPSLLILALHQAMTNQPKRLNERSRFPEWRFDIKDAIDDLFPEFASPRARTFPRRTSSARHGIAPG
jgi:hypothetical protein